MGNFISMIKQPTVGSSENVLSHELGHILGLPHTFGNTCDGNIRADDSFLDTYHPDCNLAWIPASATAQYTSDCGGQLTGVSNNIMGYNSTRNYLSPLQIAKIHMYASNELLLMTKIDGINTYDASSSVTIIGNETWSYSKIIKGDVIINPGAKLIVNCKVFFTHYGKVVVKAGGQLIVDGGTLTSIGNYLWNGIYVGGNPNQNQYINSTQGKCYFINGTLIKSELGIQNLNYPYVSYGGLTGSGGVIRVKDSKFLNNETSIHFYPYLNHLANGTLSSDFSYIKNCEFECDYQAFNLFNTLSNMYFIKLEGVNGIGIIGNFFHLPSSIVGLIDNVSQRPSAIYSNNSSFYLKDYCNDFPNCSNIIQNSFYGLFYGIKAYNYNPTNTITVDDALFNNTYRGIYLESTSQSTITRCSFKILPLDNSFTSLSPEPYGIYYNSCTGLKVTENNFNVSTNYTTYDQNYGIIVNNSGDQTNEVYNNYFNNQYVGISAQNWNRSTTVNTSNHKNDGLKIKCNDFISNIKKNVIVTGDNNNTGNYGISIFQGKPINTAFDKKMLAGNTFTNTGINSDWDFYNEFSSAKINYYTNYFDPFIGSRPNWTPKNNYNLTGFPQNFIFTYIKSENCPSKVTPLIPTTLQSNMQTYYTNIKSAALVLHIWEDGGDETLEQQVNTAYPWETYQLYNDLMLESPYLSDDVLIAAINNTSVLPDALLKLILIANPHSTTSPDVVEALNNRVPPLPQTMYDEIMSHQDDYSPITELKADIAYWTQEYYLAFNELLYSYENDTINSWAKDSVYAILGRDNKVSNKLALAEMYFYNGEASEYNSLINSLTNLSEDDNLLETEFLSFFNTISNFNYSSISNTSVSQQDINQLSNLASTGKTKYAAYARSLLIRIQGIYPYTEPIFDVSASSSRMSKTENDPLIVTKNFRIYPNPSIDYITIEVLNGNYPELSVQIMSEEGKLVKRLPFLTKDKILVINLTDITPGNYTVLIDSSNKRVFSKNIIVTK